MAYAMISAMIILSATSLRPDLGVSMSETPCGEKKRGQAVSTLTAGSDLHAYTHTSLKLAPQIDLLRTNTFRRAELEVRLEAHQGARGSQTLLIGACARIDACKVLSNAGDDFTPRGACGRGAVLYEEQEVGGEQRRRPRLPFPL